ncbi:nuclear transport factor 2 family protein [Allorhizocola rhizosphaerae]|uniref:nuclear transport factor 2 family protein n=1 Tax=Allorhizocola rhizosphaerae TaxID=1872709 RepID=UPI000E3C2A49|nr:nuclear transport factor 2 family protein [Allorhizocola rhizosphaerae]
MSQSPPDVRKSVRVNVPIERAWAIFTERPIEWWPDSHVLVKSPREQITFEPFVGGRYFERAVDGSECQWGVMLEWNPPKRLAMTWRINGRWQMIDNDEAASEIEVNFTEISPDVTEVELAHVKLWKHGPDGEAIHRALDGPSPGETLAKYAKAVERHLKLGMSNVELDYEVRAFYARQMRLLDNLQIVEYANTFTEDGWIEHAHRGEKAVGRETMIAGMRAALPRYQGIVVRHWFDHLTFNRGENGDINVTYYTLVTRTDAAGNVTFEPTFTVDDALVWVDGELQTKSRYIVKDTPAQ